MITMIMLNHSDLTTQEWYNSENDIKKKKSGCVTWAHVRAH